MSEQLRTLATLDELDSAVALSSERPVVIFKHSPTCGLSAQAFESVTEFLDKTETSAHWFVLTVRDNRSLSVEVATRFGIRHESPQALVVKEGKLVWHGSHFRATSRSIVAALEKLAAA